MKEITLIYDEKDYRTNESYKSLRTNIEFSGTDNKVIAFTSCTPNEGKSTVSLLLSMSLAEGGKKVLFVDADLRKSVIAGRYHVNEEIKGLSHFLSGQSEVGDVMYKTQLPGLAVVFAGVTPPNPAELLGNKRFESFVLSARKIYDYIIIDTPPLGSVIDSAIVAKVCDASVLVIASREISYRFAQTVKEQMEMSGCPILGVVLNKVDMKKNGYYGRYYGRYYGKYYGRYGEK